MLYCFFFVDNTCIYSSYKQLSTSKPTQLETSVSTLMLENLSITLQTSTLMTENQSTTLQTLHVSNFDSTTVKSSTTLQTLEVSIFFNTTINTSPISTETSTEQIQDIKSSGTWIFKRRWRYLFWLTNVLLNVEKIISLRYIKLLIFLRAFYVPLTFLYVRYMQRLKQNGAKRKMFVLSLFYRVDLSSVIWQIRDSDFNQKKQLFCNHFQTKEKN